MNREKMKNDLLLQRRARGLSRKQVASVLGYKSASTIARLERGLLAPSLKVVLRLELLYHTPIAYLYPILYSHLREEFKVYEARLPIRSRPTSSKNGGGDA